jgi:addiction module HigA family antidote
MVSRLKTGVENVLPNFRTATHPGTILREEFLEPMRLTQAELARSLRIPLNRINEMVRGKRRNHAAIRIAVGRVLRKLARILDEPANRSRSQMAREEMRKKPGRVARNRGTPHPRAAGADSQLAVILMPTASAACTILSPSSSRQRPASIARQLAPARCIVSMVFVPMTGTSKRIS